MKTEEELISLIFDKTVETFGLMIKRLSTAIEKDKLPKRTHIACSILNGVLSYYDNVLTPENIKKIVKLSYELADEFLAQESI